MKRRTNARKKVNLKQVAFTRFMLIVAFFIIWIGGISVRLVHLQVNQHEELKEKASGQRRDVRSVRAPRGTIFDRNGRILAMSVRVKTLYADATVIEDTKAAAKKIAKVIGVKESELAEKLVDAKLNERKYVPLLKGLDELDVDRINKELDDPEVRKSDSPRFIGLHWREAQKRTYPQQTLAAHIIGFSDAEGVGRAGIEQSQNDVLYGAVIRKTQERDRLGRVYDETISEKEPPKDVVLTIDSTIQYKTERALEKAATASGAKSGMALVIDNETGEVLALANYPTFDPNDLGTITKDNLRNSAIQSMYSPGSVFKLVTYGAALDGGLITPEAMIDGGNGTITIAKHRFTDSHAVGRVTYSKALAQSSNVCAIKTALKVGKDDFHGMVTRLGFGRPTGIALPAETGGIVRDPEKWNGDSLASMSIGYEIGVSALQMTTAFATIANDGVRVQPRIIKEIKASEDEVVSAPDAVKTQVFTKEIAEDLKGMLEQVVLTGTGKRARLNGYTSAGKTGTAWKFDEKLKRVNSAKYISSFIGFAPVEDPRITIAVVIDEPKIGGRNGGQVAAPAFREIAETVLPELNVPAAPGSMIANLFEQDEEIPEESVGNGFDEDDIANEGTAPSSETVAENAAETVKADAPKPEKERAKIVVDSPAKNSGSNAKPEKDPKPPARKERKEKERNDGTDRSSKAKTNRKT